jgi:formamidopyrimidine-DNA glycosylase
VLVNPRRLGRVWLNPDIGALGPDATQVTPAQFRALGTTGTTTVKARLLDQSNRLYRALTSVLESAIAKGGAHTGEMIAARHPGGTCPRDGAPMAHGTEGGRSTWWCSREQALRPDQQPHARH